MLAPAYRPRMTTPRRSSATQAHEAYPFQSPLSGIDVSQPLPGGNPLTAVRLDNLIPRTLGCQLRRGFTRWLSNMPGEVRSLMQYAPATGVPQQFAGCSDGNVYDVTVDQPTSFTPVPVVTTTNGLPPGEWTSLNFTTSTGNHYLVMVNLGAGMWVYDGTVWTEVTAGTGPLQIDAVDPKLFSYVTVYKSRLIFIEGGSTRAWYLPVGQIAGVAAEFDFGAMLPNGGSLQALVNWTFDGGGATSGGGGLSNNLVIIAREGDVLVYTGDDIDAADSFRVVGRWFVGRVPVGGRFFSQYLTDIIILSERGMCFLSELMRGQGFWQNSLISKNINSEIAPLIARTLESRYWEVLLLPHEQLLMFNIPDFNGENTQLVFEVNNKAFCTLRGIPALTFSAFQGKTFCGDLNGNVWWAFEGQTDGAVDGVDGKDLEGLVVTSFQPLGEGIRVKRFLMVRPSFIADSPPKYQAQLNSEWNIATPGTAPPFLREGENLWDQGTWDTAVWGGVGKSYESWVGVTGTGRYGALSMRVRGSADTQFIGWQALVEAGGIL